MTEINLFAKHTYLNLLDPKGEHLHFSTHYRPIGAPQPHSSPPPSPSQLNKNLLVTRPKHSLLGEQNRVQGKVGGSSKLFFFKKNTHVCSYVW